MSRRRTEFLLNGFMNDTSSKPQQRAQSVERDTSDGRLDSGALRCWGNLPFALLQGKSDRSEFTFADTSAIRATARRGPSLYSSSRPTHRCPGENPIPTVSRLGSKVLSGHLVTESGLSAHRLSTLFRRGDAANQELHPFPDETRTYLKTS